MNIKRIVVASLVGMSLFAFTGCNSVEKTQAKIDATVVAEVNGEEITRQDLDTYPQTVNLIDYVIETYGADDEDAEAAENTEATENVAAEEDEVVELTDEEKIEKLAAIVENNEEAVNLLKEQKLTYLDAMVLEKILLQETEKRELVPTEEEIEKSVEEIYEEQKAQFESEEQFNEALAASNYTEEILRNMIRNNVILEKLQEEILKDVTVDEEEVKKYYDENSGEFDPTTYTLAHILVETEEEAKEVKAKIDAGEDFTELAAEYSIDPGSAEAGGEIGTVPVANSGLVQEFMDGAMLLDDGEVSGPVQSEYGYHIIKCIEKDEKSILEYEEVKESIEAQLKTDKETEVINAEVERLQEEADTKIYEDKIV